MLNGQTIAVVVPAYNEESQIGMVIETMPDFVDRIIVVNDGSKDNTADIVLKYIKEDKSNTIHLEKKKYDDRESLYKKADYVLSEIRQKQEILYPKHKIINNADNSRIVLVNKINSGVGSSVAVGYKVCRDYRIDCIAVMDGDGQMDPNELFSIVSPIVTDGVDYVKGNRLVHPAAKYIIPKIRYLGNTVLSLLTKIASGYWSISDTQTGYTAISLAVLDRMNLFDIYPSYGYPNDILVKLNVAGGSIKSIPIKPVYNVGEKSKMKIFKVIPRISWLLTRGFFKRLWNKYFITSFHPLFIFYMLGLLMGFVNIPIFIKILIDVLIKGGSVTTGWYMTFLLLTLFSFQSIGFAMWMDMQDNSKLEIKK